MRSEKRKLNTRAFVALMVGLSSLGLPITGIGVHVHAFEPMSVELHAWASSHSVLGLLFTVFSVWHVVLNRRFLSHHLKSVAGQLPTVSREAALAATVVGVALLLVVGHAFVAEVAR